MIKESPYIVKESGYAGFVLPIDVYLKNKEEPKKISFQYDLQLQPSGPPISRVLREPRLFQNPSEDFRRKLIRGGGVGVDTPSEVHSDDLKSSSSINLNRSKVTDSLIKKHKPDLTPNDSFAELFGTPIRRVLEPKKTTDISKKSNESDDVKDKKKPNKYSFKDEKELVKDKEKLIEKDKIKDREKIKEKSLKRLPSPSSVVSHSVKSREEYKKYEERKKENYEEKRKKEKDKKEKDSKDVSRQMDKEYIKVKKNANDLDHMRKNNAVKKHEAKSSYDRHNIENLEKEKERPEKEKHKHRHKKKEKEKSRDKEKHKKEIKEKEKSNKKKHDDSREEKEKKKSISLSPIQEKIIKKKPLNALLDELGSSDSASPLSEDETIPSIKILSKPPNKIVPEIKPQPVVNVNPKLQSTNFTVQAECRAEKEFDKTSKGNESSLFKTSNEKYSNKKKKKIEKDDLKQQKIVTKQSPHSNSSERENEEIDKDRLKEKKDKQEKDKLDGDRSLFKKEKENRKRKGEKSKEKNFKSKKNMSQENSRTPSRSTESVDLSDGGEEIRRSDKFTKEYVAQLRDLQHRIMSLEDNAELQKVVKVIAETGQYEITKKTFDFDLCALDIETVKRLQEFFLPT